MPLFVIDDGRRATVETEEARETSNRIERSIEVMPVPPVLKTVK